MSKGLVCAVVLIISTVSWAQDRSRPETLVRWQFVGTEQLRQITDLKELREILTLPQTAALGESFITNFSTKAAARFVPSAPTNSLPRIAELIRSLSPDLLQFESRFELAASGNKDASWILALKLPTDRAGEWDTKLSTLVKTAGMRFSAPRSGEGSWKADRDGYHIAFSRSRNWVVLEGGYLPAETTAKHFNSFRSSLGRRPGKELLKTDLNLPRLADIWNAPRLAHSPSLNLAVVPRSDGLRSEMRLDYPEPLGIKPEKWNVPIESIRDPLIGFTAIQGIQEKLRKSERLQKLGLQKVPNQLFSWSQGTSPFSVFVAVDVGNPVEVVENVLKHEIPKMQKPELNLPGELLYATNRHALLWRGLPIIVPFIEPAPQPNSSFLIGGLFPMSNLGGTNLAPAELFAQLNRKNLVYYEWEITAERLKQWRPIWQLRYIVGSTLLPMSSAPSEKWLEAATAHLGNCVTEITLENPRQLKVVRQSPAGFNAAELLLLAHWLDPHDLSTGILNRPRRPVKPPVAPVP